MMKLLSVMTVMKMMMTAILFNSYIGKIVIKKMGIYFDLKCSKKFIVNS
jgi:hypothetical protein